MSIKIAHLYGDLLNLYGGRGNLTALVRRLVDAGETVEVIDVSVGNYSDISGSNIIYIGAGTEKRTLTALNDIRRLSGAIIDCMSYEGLVLCSGSSSYMFGESITGLDGSVTEGLGFGAYKTVYDEKRRYGEFIMKTLVTELPVVGCINTSATVDWKDDYLFSVQYASEKMIGETEGLLTTGLVLTEMQGPILWRNPALLDYVASKAVKHPLLPDSEDWYRTALVGYTNILSQLQKNQKG